MIHTIRVQTTSGKDLKAEDILHEIKHFLKINAVSKIKIVKVYRLEGITKNQARKLTENALYEKINQVYAINEPIIKDAKQVFEIAYKPGVMNPEVGSIQKAARDLNIPLQAADSSFEYALYGNIKKEEIDFIIKKLNLLNPTTEYLVIKQPKTLLIAGTVGKTKIIPIRSLSDNLLEKLSRDSQLFLNLEEMQCIKSYFKKIKRDPTDCEIEVLAQTWSEHCMHKTFKANLIIDGKKKSPLFDRIKNTVKKNDPKIISAFSDNSGVIDFYDDYAICAKVETHNSPSAIEPYGGAMTGSGGVFRDVLGTGQGAKILSASDIFCFARPDLPEKDIPPGCLPPKYLLKKVVSGVRDYGNRVGVPTNNGSIHFHNDFRAKPTIAVGAFGILKKKNAQKGRPRNKDLVLTIGGRTGRDGIHGATFSSGEMNDQTVTTSGSAVQIGNAIEEKRMIDAILELSNLGLIRAITDCGAGGFASAVGEMGKDTGVTIHLEQVPLKYPGLSPWEIFLSESQERMTLAIDPKYKKTVETICQKNNVEVAIIGNFDISKKLNIYYKNEKICNLSMQFLHDGLPKRLMTGITKKRTAKHSSIKNPKNYLQLWKKILTDGNVCSKEPIVRLYDHNVQGTNALHPFGGVSFEGPNDGSIVKPFFDKPYGLVMTHGLNPVLNEYDPFWGSVWTITEALSNYVAIGGDLQDAALIDNFIWPFPDEASLADLDASVDACSKMAQLLNLPFVSGKDSLSSTYRYPNNEILKIPPVLLISVFGKIPDVTKTASSDFKKTNSVIVFVGKQDTSNMGGSTYLPSYNNIPQVDLTTLSQTLHTITKGVQNNTILSCHDISEGGIAATIGEMCFGAGFGATLDLAKISKGRPDFTFFNETAGTFLVEVTDVHAATKLFKNTPYSIIGKTEKSKTITISFDKKQIVKADIHELKNTWQKPMKELFT